MLNAVAKTESRFFLPITKIDKAQRMVYGYASTPARDFEGDTITMDAIKAALPGYLLYSNLREMHQLSAVGTTKEASVDDKGLYIGAKVVDDAAWNKVLEGVYKGFSIGGRATKFAANDNHCITGLDLIEISLVDRPANPECLIEVFKAAQVNKEASPMAVDKTAQLRETLIKAVNDLDADQLEAAVAAFAKHEQPKPEPLAKTAGTDDDADGDEVVEQPQPPAISPQTIAKRLKDGSDKDGTFQQIVTKALKMRPEQFGGIMLLNEQQISNWIGNNAGFLEAISKACAESEVSPAVDRQAVRPIAKVEEPKKVEPAAAVVTKTAGAGEEPNGDYGAHAEAHYADPGYTPDNKARFPLKEAGAYSPARIKAAHGFMAKAMNQQPYSPEQLEHINEEIDVAWKAAVDENGPPAAEGDAGKAVNPTTEKTMNVMTSADSKGNLRKGLMTVCAAISLLDSLDSLQKSLAREAATEGDDSAMPARFDQLLTLMASAVNELLGEEVGEMLDNRDTNAFPNGYPDYPSYIAYADKAQGLLKAIGGGEQRAAILIKAIGDKTGSPGYANLVKFAEDEIAKASKDDDGTWPGKMMDTTGGNDKWMAKAQGMHDACVQLGATCTTVKADMPAKGKDMKKDPSTKKADVAVEVPKAAAAKKDPPPADEEDDSDKGGDGGDEENENDDGSKKDDGKKAAKKAAAVDAGTSKVESMLTTLMSELTEVKAQLGKRRDPALPTKGAPKVVDKGADATKIPARAGEEGKDAAKSPADVLKACRETPNFLRT